MNTVLVSSPSRYPIKRKRIKQTVLDYLKTEKLQEVEVSVAIVGSRKIRELSRIYLKLDEETTVLTFAAENSRDTSGVLRLGDVVISYPGAREIAQDYKLMMDGAIDKLLIHGLNNLTGKNKY